MTLRQGDGVNRAELLEVLRVDHTDDVKSQQRDAQTEDLFHFFSSEVVLHTLFFSELLVFNRMKLFTDLLEELFFVEKTIR